MQSINKAAGASADVTDLSKVDIEPGELAKVITRWNAVTAVAMTCTKLVKDSSRGYEKNTITKMESDVDDFRKSNFRLKYLYKYALKHASDLDAIKNLIPEPKMVEEK